MFLEKLLGGSNRLDFELRARVAPSPVGAYRTATKQLPLYRFADLFNAAEAICGRREGVHGSGRKAWRT